ncbi:MAG TPA: thiopeptide-type bacteriocin [Allosphingosinicella sp.]|nr:thiopeptide-type bacteriocin [Allosphingosinicella sp.]
MLKGNEALSISLDDIDLSDIDSFEVEVLNSADTIALPEAGASWTPWYSCSCSCPQLPTITE